MNIFVLDYDIPMCAQYHCDKHVVKMPLETAQILSTVHVACDNNQVAYRPTHINHPCTKWARESKYNYIWLFTLFYFLQDEYKFRYGKIHKSWKDHNKVLSKPPSNIPDIGFTPFALAMPDVYKTNDPVESYREYYLDAKAHILDYKKREIPYWVL